MHCLEAMYECYNAPRTKKKQTGRLNATTIIRRSRSTSPDVLIFLVLRVLRQEINLEQLEVGRWWRREEQGQVHCHP